MKKSLAFISVFCSLCILFLCFLLFPINSHADTQVAENMHIILNNELSFDAHGISVSYDNNEYVSLRDIAYILKDTDKAFDLVISNSQIAIKTKDSEIEDPDIAALFSSNISFDDYELDGWTSLEKSSFSSHSQSFNKLTVNGDERKYYTMLFDRGGSYDCFIGLIDLCLLLDIDAYQDGDDVTYIDTTIGMKPVNPAFLEGYGYFQNVNSVLVGDATTLEIFYEYNSDKAYPIASTTKLMTYLLTMDAIKSGQISLNDKVSVSSKAVELSKTSDGVTPMREGMQISVSELINGALLPSSNECCLSLAEYIAGDEANFVELMKEKANLLNMNSAIFYNSNGLPIYTDDIIPAKLQNQMNTRDMFTLCSTILNTYPEIKTVTSQKKADLEALNLEVKNTNALLYNMKEVNGLKTGTTTKSGACLVTSLTVSDGATNHDIVIVLLGAEGAQDRFRVSELLADYAKAVVAGEAEKITKTQGNTEENIAMNAEAIVNLIVNSALKEKSK